MSSSIFLIVPMQLKNNYLVPCEGLEVEFFKNFKQADNRAEELGLEFHDKIFFVLETRGAVRGRSLDAKEVHRVINHKLES